MEIILFILFLLEIILVSILDIKFRKVSNIWPLANLTLFAILCVIDHQSYILSFELFYLPLAFFISGFILFCFGIMGAGDVKFISTYLLLFPENLHFNILIGMLWGTLLLGGAFFLFNILKNIKLVLLSIRTLNFSFLKGVFGTKFPYTPVVLIAIIWLGKKMYF